MKVDSIELQDTQELRERVRSILCRRQELQPGEYPLLHLPLKRGEELCGEVFIQHGPRLLRLLAVWDYATGTVHYYDCNGERFLIERVRVLKRAA